jgi:hypothetical protein
MIDYSACTGIKPLSAELLAKWATGIADTHNKYLQLSPKEALKLDKAVAQGSIVEERIAVREEKYRDIVTKGPSLGWVMCGMHSDFIFLGGAFHQVFIMPDGSTLKEDTIDKASCLEKHHARDKPAATGNSP